MLSIQTLLENITRATELTRSAVESAENNDWNQAQSFIQQRQDALKNLPGNYLDYSEEQQNSIRSQLQQLDSMNTHFLSFVNHSRDEVMQLKSSLSKNRDAINQYLNHA